MSIHEYRCSKCGKISEIMVGVCDEDDPLECKSCGSDMLEKIPAFTGVASVASRPKGQTCCGRDERCDKPPCSSGRCGRD